jgi:hypothetical protein
MHITLSWKGIGFDWQMSQLTSIEAGMQPISQASDEEHSMEARLAATKVRQDIGHELLVFRKMMQGRTLRISPTPL